MNKKITSSTLAALIIAGSTSFTAFAAMDNGTVVIGNKAFDLAYANDLINTSEITSAIIAGGAIYVKDFDGKWIDNLTGETTSAGLIPAVVYKNTERETKFDAADTSVTAVKETSYPKTFTSITNAITNISKVIYLTALDQYGEAYDIKTDSSYKVTATINGMPLSDTQVKLTTDNNMAKITLDKDLVENDVVVIKLDKFDKDVTTSSAKLISEVSTNFVVEKDVAITPKSILGVASSMGSVSIEDAAVTLSADVRDQYNNPTDLTANKLRWVVEQGGDLLDTNSELNSGKTTLDKNSNTTTFKAIKPGFIIISAYNIINGAKATYSVQVSEAKLSQLNLTSERPVTEFNNEDIIYNKITQNDGAILTTDMIKFNINPKTSGTVASDVTVTASLRGGSDANKNDIIISAKSTKEGTYEVTPYVGTTFDAEGTIKATKFDVTTTVNGIATTIDSITLPKLKVNTKTVTNLLIRNAHNEVIQENGNNVTALVYRNGVLDNNLIVEKLDIDGKPSTTRPVKSLRFNAKEAGNYIVRLSVNGTVAMKDVVAISEVTSLESIELGNNITDNSIIANEMTPVYRVIGVVDNKGDEIIPGTSGWTIEAKNKEGTNFDSFASIVYYKHDARGVIIDATTEDAEGIAVKFAPNATSVNSLQSDTTLVVKVGNKTISSTDVIKDTLDVTVRAKSKVKSITLADNKISTISGASVKKEIVILDQYGKAITDPTMVKVLYGSKTTATVSYDDRAKKMYITYFGEATGIDTIVVKSLTEPAITATANISIGDNTNINTIVFNENKYKVYNDANNDVLDGSVALTYKVNDGDIDVPTNALHVISDSKLVTVTTDGSVINVKAKAGVNTATTGIGSDTIITISVLTANGKTDSINLTFSDDASIVTPSTVAIKDTVDENKDLAGTQLIIGRDEYGNVVNETTGRITLLGVDQYGNKDIDVTTDTTWTSSNSAIAKVDANIGLVTAVKPGKTTITGFYKGNLYTIEVEIPEVK
ncbi:Ig-like domain-containing protein [Clostridium estertheticum]|uniref:Ig-like domain-containing protein n=1 Tax=Clostridium estertheticum TaxID=238834 RepID=UPI001C0CA5A6|nr:Ig-like domain-containing protein [Clostridium estertheticum]MBU3218206.1 Ig-like domain-containing protein [Clostridium estertheticum]WAG53892.1 Ig-like domain-containing protein [Clostridium estertheticum]